jgi:hypothetical protein
MLRSTNLEGFLVSSSYEVTGYVLPFRAKTAQFCGSDSWRAGTMPVACAWMELVRRHCRMLRSTNIEGFLVPSSYEVKGYVLPFRAKMGRFYGSDSWHAGTVPVACVRMKLVR